MGVVVIAMLGWVGTGMEVVDGKHVGRSQGGLRHVGRCLSTSRVRGEDTDDTQSHRLPGAQLWVWSSLNWSVILGRPEHRMSPEGSGSLSEKPVSRTPWCSTDADIGVSELCTLTSASIYRS